MSISTKFAEKIAASQLKGIRELQANAPVHIVPIATRLGVAIFKNDTFPDGVSGLIRKLASNESGDTTYEIHVNANHPITRQRFTMAHELAHFLLHKEQIGDGVTDDFLYRSTLSSSIEREANELAAELLMPEHLLLDNGNEKLTLSQQADKFWVSRASMDIRLGKLLT